MHPRRRTAVGRWLLALAAETGLAAATWVVAPTVGVGTYVVALLVAVGGAAGALVADAVAPASAGPRLARDLLAPTLGLGTVGLVLVVPVDVLAVAAWGLGAVAVLAWRGRRFAVTAAGLAAVLGVAQLAGVQGAGAWSADEPHATAAQLKAGNGVVVAVDTHAFLIRQAAVILRNDGHTALADFLESPDPTAPEQRTADGAPAGEREPYLWRVQLGSVDADGKLKKTEMPDHFFNFWTHSGKGTIAGPSAATYAEQQYAQAVTAWQEGDRSTAMYHLGSAVHLVDDACAPPHASPYVPNHRAYEEWVVPRQDQYAVTSGGIYRTDFRVDDGHGGPEWSSSHTRGWVDECAHRAAGLQINTMRPPPDDPAGGAYAGTMAHFEETQRLTAGYLAFFFEQVGAFG